MKLPYIILACILLLSTNIIAQKYTFGEVTIAELEQKSDLQFPEANAVVLYREVISNLGELVTVHERIKIFNKEGYEYATVRIPYADVIKVKGATYNLVDGQVVETKLDKKLIFTDEEIKGVEIKKFTFPKVEPGSVLELSYQSRNYTTSDIYLQYDIPIKKVKVEVSNFTSARFNILQNPRAFLKVNRNNSNKTTSISALNVPALEAENYVYDMDLFRHKLTLDILSIDRVFKVETWEGLAKILWEIDDFSYQVKPKGLYKDIVQELIAGKASDLDKTEAIYNYLKAEIEHNKKISYWPSNGTRDTFKEKKGNSADINMLFISMLNSIDIEANPVLISTRDNGIPLSANLNAFNYLVTGVNLDGGTRLFDAASVNANFDMLPKALLNWRAFLMKPNGQSEWIDLGAVTKSAKSIMVNASINEELLIAGDARERNTGYYDISVKKFVKDLGENKLEDIVVYDAEGLEIFEVSVDGEKDKMSNISFDFELDNALDEIDGKLYFSPMLFLALTENPFKKDERKYNVDFIFPFKQQSIMNIALPENYKIESLPTSVKINLPDDLGSFTYRISENAGKVQIASQFEINRGMMPFNKYINVKEFFNERIKKETEKVVLTKI